MDAYELTDRFFEDENLTKITTVLRALKSSGGVLNAYFSIDKNDIGAMAYMRKIFDREIGQYSPFPLDVLLSEQEQRRANLISEELR